MSFLENLGKGLIRSAVNQVGRDAGRVISNQLYGDSHSTPHRLVNDNATPIINDEDGVAQYAKEQTMTGIILRIIVAFVFNVFGGIALLIYGLRKKSKAAFVTIYRYEQVPIYKKDNRYKMGVRYMGDMTVKKKYYTTADEDTEKKHKQIANIYIYSGMIISAICIIIAIVLELQK